MLSGHRHHLQTCRWPWCAPLRLKPVQPPRTASQPPIAPGAKFCSRSRLSPRVPTIGAVCHPQPRHAPAIQGRPAARGIATLETRAPHEHVARIDLAEAAPAAGVAAHGQGRHSRWTGTIASPSGPGLRNTKPALAVTLVDRTTAEADSVAWPSSVGRSRGTWTMAGRGKSHTGLPTAHPTPAAKLYGAAWKAAKVAGLHPPDHLHLYPTKGGASLRCRLAEAGRRARRRRLEPSRPPRTDTPSTCAAPNAQAGAWRRGTSEAPDAD